MMKKTLSLFLTLCLLLALCAGCAGKPAETPDAPADNGNATLARLNENLERGIKAVVTIDGNDGVAKNLERYNKLQRPL